MAAAGNIPSPGAEVRQFLKKEIPAWVTAGIITTEGGETLRLRYELDRPDRESTNKLLLVILILGSMFVGGGVISLVAANWLIIPAAAKIAGLFILMGGLHLASVHFGMQGRRALGQALSLGGCICMGAGIGLMAQIFHIPSYDNTAIIIWAAGTLAVAWAYPSAVTGLLALTLASWWFFDSKHLPGESLQGIIYRLFPLIALAGFVTLGIHQKSRLLFIGALGMALFSGMIAGKWSFGLLEITALGAFAWALGAVLTSYPGYERLGLSARAVGFIGFASSAFIWAFRHGWWSSRRGTAAYWTEHGWTIALALIAAAALAGLAYYRRASGGVHPVVFRFVAAGGGLLFLIGLGSTGTDVKEFATVGPLLANISVVLLAAAAIASGIFEAHRSHFWAGTFLLIITVFARFVEFDTGLIAKGIIFIALGIAMMYAGLQYEKFLKSRREAGA